MENDSVTVFFKHYQRTLRHIGWASRLGFHCVSRWLAVLGGYGFLERRHSKAAVARNLMQFMALSSSEAVKVSRKWFAGFGLSALAVYQLPRWNQTWVEKHYKIQTLPNPHGINDVFSQKALSVLREHGGLVMMYHLHHNQNVLAALLGVYGVKVNALSAARNPEHDHPLIRPFHIELMHDMSECFFNGGRYLYLNQLRQTLKQANQCLSQGEAVIALADIPASGQRTVKAPFLNTWVQIDAWQFEMAIKHRTEVFFTILVDDTPCKKPRLIIQKSSQTDSVETLAAEYMQFLENVIRQYPGAWQGMEWLDQLVCEAP